MHHWEWLQLRIPCTNWNEFIARLPPNQAVYRVDVGDSVVGYKQLIEITPETFSTVPPTEYTGELDAARHFAKVDDLTFWINPYPNDLESQARVRFWIQDSIAVPTVASDVFANVPERMIALFVKKLSYHLATRHLGDFNLASAFQGEFEQLVQSYRNREAGNTNRSLNMYGGSRRRQ
jgi:hypothetical protein